MRVTVERIPGMSDSRRKKLGPRRSRRRGSCHAEEESEMKSAREKGLEMRRRLRGRSSPWHSEKDQYLVML